MKSTTYFAGAVLAVLALGLVPVAPHGARSGLGLVPPAAQAQGDISFRVVSGIVMDGDSNPVNGATVFLKNLKTKSIRSFTSTTSIQPGGQAPESGVYQFAGCNMAVDFELWAEKGDKKSAVKTVSSWDTRKQFIANLKLK